MAMSGRCKCKWISIPRILHFEAVGFRTLFSPFVKFNFCPSWFIAFPPPPSPPPLPLPETFSLFYKLFVVDLKQKIFKDLSAVFEINFDSGFFVCILGRDGGRRGKGRNGEMADGASFFIAVLGLVWMLLSKWKICQ